MKRNLFILLLLSLAIKAAGQGITFSQGSLSDIQKKAEEKNLPIFLDIYTSWCGPCKMMATQVFTQQEVGDYFNAHFINYKIDAEKGEGIEIAQRYNVSAYPTCLFLSPKGQLVSSFMGAQKAGRLIKEGEKAIKNFALLPQLNALEKEYVNGKRDKEFLRTYCNTREDFGEKGGEPVKELVNRLNDDELVTKDGCRWIQSMTVYDAPLLNRLIENLETFAPTGEKKEVNAYNGAIMRALSCYINQVIDNGNRTAFENLMACKLRMTSLFPTNNDNGMSASMGGGMAYIAEEQIRLTFYLKNHYEEDFSKLFLSYLDEKRKEYPTDSLLTQSEQVERYYHQILSSDTVSNEKKEQIRRGRGMMRLFSGVKTKLLSTTLYNAAEHYWKLHQPANEELRRQYTEWLLFFYALDRSANIGLPAAEKLIEIRKEEEAKHMIDDLIQFLILSGDPDQELEKVKSRQSQWFTKQ